MATLYECHCKNCGYRTEAIDALGAILLDGPAETELRHPDDDRIAVLPEPGSMSALERMGYTDSSATLQGRYLVCRDCFCRSCGHLYEVRRLHFSGAAGCWPFLAFGPASGLALGIAVGLWRASIMHGVFYGVMGAIVGGVSALYVADAVVARRLRSRYADRAREVDTERRCPECGSSKAVSSGGAWLVSLFRRLPCPECKSRSVRIKHVGIT